MILFNLAGIVPDGMVVFVPSYAFLASVKTMLEKNGMWEKLGARKQVRVLAHRGASSCSEASFSTALHRARRRFVGRGRPEIVQHGHFDRRA